MPTGKCTIINLKNIYLICYYFDMTQNTFFDFIHIAIRYIYMKNI